MLVNGEPDVVAQGRKQWPVPDGGAYHPGPGAMPYLVPASVLRRRCVRLRPFAVEGGVRFSAALGISRIVLTGSPLKYTTSVICCQKVCKHHNHSPPPPLCNPPPHPGDRHLVPKT